MLNSKLKLAASLPKKRNLVRYKTTFLFENLDFKKTNSIREKAYSFISFISVHSYYHSISRQCKMILNFLELEEPDPNPKSKTIQIDLNPKILTRAHPYSYSPTWTPPPRWCCRRPRRRTCAAGRQSPGRATPSWSCSAPSPGPGSAGRSCAGRAGTAGEGAEEGGGRRRRRWRSRWWRRRWPGILKVKSLCCMVKFKCFSIFWLVDFYVWTWSKLRFLNYIHDTGTYVIAAWNVIIFAVLYLEISPEHDAVINSIWALFFILYNRLLKISYLNTH